MRFEKTARANYSDPRVGEKGQTVDMVSFYIVLPPNIATAPSASAEACVCVCVCVYVCVRVR